MATTSDLLSAAAQLESILTAAGTNKTLPSLEALSKSTASLHDALPASGLGSDATATHLLQDLIPGLNGSSLSPNYYGFVTGGATPIARLADQIVGTWDQNVSVHLPKETIASIVEDKAMKMLIQLCNLDPSLFVARIFTTGATASNILGLASGRDYILAQHSAKAGIEYDPTIGLLASCKAAGVEKIQILTTIPHSSLGKAASIVGLGSASMIDVSTNGGSITYDMKKLEEHLAEKGAASIVAVSCSEVNLGAFATNGQQEMQAIRDLCDKYGAWLHVDAAFGIFATLLPSKPQYQSLLRSTEGLELADSITSDGHKLLNVPYDTGIFFSRHANVTSNVFSNPNAPYLRSTANDGIISPLNIGLENSRRWRALPVYANLVAYGRQGYSDMMVRMTELARGVARFIVDECPYLEVLFPESKAQDPYESIFMIVAFRERDQGKNATLVQRIKDDRRIYVSGTVLKGQPAARIAVSKWDVDVERDLGIVKDVLRSLA